MLVSGTGVAFGGSANHDAVPQADWKRAGRGAGLRQRWVNRQFLNVMDKDGYLDFVVEFIRRSNDEQEFLVLPLHLRPNGLRLDGAIV